MYSRWNFVANMYESWDMIINHKLSYVISKQYADSVEIAHIFLLQFQVYKYIRFHVRNADFRLKRIELCTGPCCHQRWLRYPQNNLSNVEFAPHRWFTPFYWMATKFITFHQEIIHPSNSLPVTPFNNGWTHSITGCRTLRKSSKI